MERLRKNNALADRLRHATSAMAYQPSGSQIYAYSLIVVLLFATPVCLAQSQQGIKKSAVRKAEKAFKKAEEAFFIADYLTAQHALQQAIHHNPSYTEAWLMLAELKLETNRKEEALTAFQNLIKTDSTKFPMVYGIMAQLYYEKANYDTAVYLYKKALSSNNLRPEAQTMLKEKLIIASTAAELFNTPYDMLLTPIPGMINTEADEYINSLRLDGHQLLFTRKTASISGKEEISEERFFISESDTVGIWRTAVPLVPDWEGLGNMGALSFSADGKTLLFTGCGWADGLGSCDIYISKMKEGRWTLPENIGKPVNSNAWESQPVLTDYGTSLLFVSNRPEGYGGSDIYMSIALEDGTWSKPINLGATINTAGNEMAPFLHPDGQTLYFSSDGHAGLGGYDLFMSKKDETGRWSKPVNLGAPVNSSEDELNLIVTLDGTKAYMSAKKAEGKGGFDIYSFELPEAFRPEPCTYVRALVIDKHTSKPLAAKLKLSDLAEQQLIFKEQLEPDGVFLIPLRTNRPYAMHISKEGYLFQSLTFRTETADINKPYELLIELEPAKEGSSIILHNIFFAWDETLLQAASYAELNELVGFLQQNPGLRIELGGHTDNTGSEAYNQTLSGERAKVVKAYLVEKGIQSERIATKAYGSSQPVADNSTEEGRSQNRRTTLTILP
ncbi:MAG: OmpA family protein [Bacteroidales bacterium]|nr:OmpA family protein [Bacteroidales bacterium]